MTAVRRSRCTGCGRILDEGHIYDVTVADRATGAVLTGGECCPSCAGRLKGVMEGGLYAMAAVARERARARADLEWRYMGRYRGIR